MQNAALVKVDHASLFSNAIQEERLLKKRHTPKRIAIKMLLVMRLTIIFMAACLLQANARGFSQTVNFSGKKVSIEKAFEAIESQTGYSVFANKSLLKGTKQITISAKEMS